MFFNQSTFGPRVTMLPIALFAIFLSHQAQATSINVDFNTAVSANYTGTGAAPDAGTKWNGVVVGTAASAAPVALVDSFNNSTAVTLDWSGLNNGFAHDVASAPFNFNITGSDSSTSNLSDAYLDLVRDQIGGNSAAAPQVVLHNLNPSLSYSLYLYEVRGGAASTLFTVTGANGPFSMESTTDNPASNSALSMPDDYVLISGILPTASGNITIDFVHGAVNTFPALNGLQLVQVPEPSSIILASVSILGFIGFVRRRS
jgi:hypothetical protein